MLALLALICRAPVTGLLCSQQTHVLSVFALTMPWRRVTCRSAGQQLWLQILKGKTATGFRAGVLLATLSSSSGTPGQGAILSPRHCFPLVQGSPSSAGVEAVGVGGADLGEGWGGLNQRCLGWPDKERMVLQESLRCSGDRSPWEILEVCLGLKQEGKNRRGEATEAPTSQWQGVVERSGSGN